MDVTDLDLCVVLPIAALDAWVRADPQTRAGWLAGREPVKVVEVAGTPAIVFRRDGTRPVKPLVVQEPRRRVAVVIGGDEAAVRAALETPGEEVARMTVQGGLLVIGGDLAHADVGGGTPVAGPHRIVDLAPGAYRVEVRGAGDARVIYLSPQ